MQKEPSVSDLATPEAVCIHSSTWPPCRKKLFVSAMLLTFEEGASNLAFPGCAQWNTILRQTVKKRFCG